MILTVDTGGTKTRLATFNDAGQIARELQFETPRDTDEYIRTLADTIRREFPDSSVVSVAAPGFLDQNVTGVIKSLPKLGWKDFHLLEKLQAQLPGKKIWFENDANLGGLGAFAMHGQPVKRGVYITLSTGIGAGFVVNGQISSDLRYAEVGFMKLYDDGEMKIWENIASGRAFFEKTGKMGSEVDDPEIWRRYARDVFIGFAAIIPTFQPGVILIGGSMGTHFAKYGAFLNEIIDRDLPAEVARPKILPAEHPEHIVNFGAKIYAEQQLAE